MAKTQHTIHIDNNTIYKIAELAKFEGRTFSAMADRLLREGLNSLEAKEATKPATD